MKNGIIVSLMKWPESVLCEGRRVCGMGSRVQTEVSNESKVWLGFGATWWYLCTPGTAVGKSSGRWEAVTGHLSEIMCSWSFTHEYIYLCLCLMFPHSISYSQRPYPVCLLVLLRAKIPSRISVKCLLNEEGVNEKTLWTRTECQEFCILFGDWRII